jgi:probable rRNA maturation factor
MEDDSLVEIVVEAGGWTKAHEDIVARAALTALDGREEATLAVLLTDDAAIQALNRRFRGKDKPTNVLSFPAASIAGNQGLLGDIAIAFETLANEAAADGKSFEAHLSHLAVHGVLHLLGEDHETPEEAERMEERERFVLARLGIADPYRDTIPTRD